MVVIADCVVVGGGFGGLYTALSLANACPNLNIQLVEERDRFCFQPLLYEYAMGIADVDEISARYEDLLPDSVELCSGRVDSLDLTKKTVSANDRLLTGRSIVVAMGNDPPLRPEGTFGFSTLEDAEIVRGWDDDEEVLVVGAGFTGVELASHLAAKGRKVSLAHRGSDILPGASSEASRETARQVIRETGVDLMLSVDIDDEFLKNREGQKIVWTAGSSPPSVFSSEDFPAVHKSPDGRLRVDAALRVRKTDGSVFGLGDNARVAGFNKPSSAQTTLQQAYVAAFNVQSVLENDPNNLKAFNYLDLGQLVTLGPNKAAAQLLPFLDGVKPPPATFLERYGLPPDPLQLDGEIASVARRLVYAARMPTNSQRLSALTGLTQKTLRRSSSP